MNNNVWFTNGLPMFTLKNLSLPILPSLTKTFLSPFLMASAPLLMKPPGVARVDLRLQ
jgi:hypothetical protein